MLSGTSPCVPESVYLWPRILASHWYTVCPSVSGLRSLPIDFLASGKGCSPSSHGTHAVCSQGFAVRVGSGQAPCAPLLLPLAGGRSP